MADYLDNFVAANGTLLSDHTADSGHKYETTTKLEINSNELVSTEPGTTGITTVRILESDGVTQYVLGAEFDLEIGAVVRSNNDEIAIAFCENDSDERYQLSLAAESANLGKKVGGSFTPLGAVAFVTGDVFTVEVRSNTLALKKNGTEVIAPFTETDLTREGFAGYKEGRGNANPAIAYAFEYASITNLSATTPTTRKSTTFDIETTLGTITTATLNSVNVFDHITGQVGTTVSFEGAATDEITTSGEYTLTLGDGTGTEDITVQVDVYGVAPSNNPLQKDGSALASLTGVQVRVTDGANINGTELYYSGAQTTDASGNLGNIDLSSTAVAESDPVLLHMRTSAGDSIIASETVELI